MFHFAFYIKKKEWNDKIKPILKRINTFVLFYFIFLSLKKYMLKIWLQKKKNGDKTKVQYSNKI